MLPKPLPEVWEKVGAMGDVMPFGSGDEVGHDVGHEVVSPSLPRFALGKPFGKGHAGTAVGKGEARYSPPVAGDHRGARRAIRSPRLPPPPLVVALHHQVRLQCQAQGRGSRRQRAATEWMKEDRQRNLQHLFLGFGPSPRTKGEAMRRSSDRARLAVTRGSACWSEVLDAKRKQADQQVAARQKAKEHNTDPERAEGSGKARYKERR